MYLIIVGAEAEGQRLIDLAMAQDHEITLIAADEDKARQVLKENEIRVLQGDIADKGILEEAEIARADAVVAATHDDAKNLMAMMLAQQNEVAIRISLINEPSHQQLFEKLGVQIVSDPASIVAQRLYQQLSESDE